MKSFGGFFMRLWARIRPQPATLGERAERLAARYLQRRGYQIVARRQRDGDGELDLVAVRDGVVVFVEVKCRRDDREHPAEAVDERKQRRIASAANVFLRRHDLLEQPSRFDIISVIWPDDGPPRVQHLPHAFEAPPDAW
ncbi:MAG: YraN family protein [Pirellulaceae bacterium]|jgi:putative endonuclease|nr:YraN family protein [Pirellulaceae bacterium]MDP7014477.1 YraN family protein [Pirellulaceae bacterium]